MKLIKSLIYSSLFLAVVFIAGCNDGPSTSNEPMGTTNQLPKFTLPAGATLVSAELNLYLSGNNDQNVNIYRNTQDWDEATVNWVNRPTYDPTVEGNFNAGPTSDIWLHIEITNLVQKWLDCVPNYGLLLDQIEETPNLDAATYASRETANGPFIVVVYSTPAGNETDTIWAIADAYIWPNAATGNTTYLQTGYVNGLEKQSLIKFDLECVPPQEVCETAYAFGGTIATCFLNLSPISANNWGWTNLITPGYTGSWPMYAGAGQCDITKGTLVGHVDVSYIAGTITIDYVLDPGFNLDETHVWIGTDKLPKKNGIYQTAPGKFNYNGIDPVVLTGQTGNKYVAVHAGVCWFEE